ncbi:MAG: efflux RND transporter permease subunit [Bryobacteraceae bacterium]
MIDGLIRWSLRNRPTVVALTAALLVWGVYLATTLPVDVLPDITAPTVTLLAEAPGMAPTELESLVTFPIETALNGASGVRRVRSATALGVAVVWTEFEWGEDVARARQVVTERLAVARSSLPPEVQIVMAPVSSIMGEILFVDLESDRHSELELRTVADTLVRRRLLAVPGVSQVIATGGAQKQYQVVLAPAKLRAYDVTVQEVEEALRRANRNTSGGFRVTGGQEYLIQGIGRVAGLEDLAATVVAARGATPVLVRDIAEVRIGGALRRGAGSHDARPAVVIGIQRQPEANTLELTYRLEHVLDEIQESLPEGMRLHREMFRQADFIEVAVGNLMHAVRDGGLLVVVVVVLFLGNLRASLITLLAIPLSLAAAIWGMQWVGFTINTMSLGGLAIAIGELVDDAIIDVENVVRRLRLNAKLPEPQRLGAMEVVYNASKEIRGSVVYATAIVVLVFAPLLFLDSVEGRLLRPLGFAYAVSLTASLIVALTITPVLCSLLLPRSKSVLLAREPRLVALLKRIYRPVLDWALRNPYLLAGGSTLLLAAALGSTFWMGRSFLPEFNEGSLTIGAVTMPGTSLEESDRLARHLERVLLTIPEVTSTGRRTGRAELDEHVQGVEASELDVNLQLAGRTQEEVVEEIRRKATLIPGMNVIVGQPISHRIDHMLSGAKANVAVKIFGDDLRMLRSLAERVEAAMRDVPGVADLASERQIDIPTVRVRFDRAALARYGLGAGEAAEALQIASIGRPVGQVFEGQLAFPLVLRYQERDFADLNAIRQTVIDTPGGARIPLSAVADIREDRSPNFISRESVQRKIVVQCNIAGRDLGSVVNEIQERIRQAVPLPQGYRIEYGGQFESQQRASARLVWLSLAVVAGLFLLLSSAFGSSRDAVIVMLNLPMALIGGAVGVFVAGGVLSVASLIGFITLFGIATRNGIMLVSHVRCVREVEGVTDFREAVARGASERLAPILMTAMATWLALIPIALGLGKPGSEIQAPMAIVILFGLLSSTLLNMLVVPAVYYRFAGGTPSQPQEANRAV